MAKVLPPDAQLGALDSLKPAKVQLSNLGKLKVINFVLSFDSPDTNGFLSSNEFADLLISGLVPADFLYTFVSRYPRLGADFKNMHEEHTESNGESLDFSSEHLWFSIIQTVVTIGAAIGGVVVAHQSMKRSKRLSSYQVLYQSYQKKLDALQANQKNEIGGADEKHDPSKPSDPKPDPVAENLNRALATALSKNEKLKKKYDNISVSAFKDENGKTTGLTVSISKKPQPTAPWYAFWDDNWTAPWLISKSVTAADTTSNMLGISSYAYWILFIGAAVFTSVFSIGVMGIPDIIGFGLPFLLGATYVGIKFKNKCSNRNTHREEQNDFNELTQEALLDIEEAENTEGMDPIAHTPSLKVNIGPDPSSILSAAVIGGVGSYVAWQYNMWYVTDVLTKIFQVALESAAEGIGIGIFVTGTLALIRAGYTAYQDYKKNKILNPGKSFWDYLKPDTMSDTLEQQLKKIQKLEGDIRKVQVDTTNIKTPQLDALIAEHKDIEAQSNSKPWVQRVRAFFHVLNFGMTGVFVARTVLVRGVTAFLLPGLAAALCLSTPWTIGILVVAGLLWGAYRYYNHRKEKNLQKIKAANTHIDLLERKLRILKTNETHQKKLDLTHNHDHDGGIKKSTSDVELASLPDRRNDFKNHSLPRAASAPAVFAVSATPVVPASPPSPPLSPITESVEVASPVMLEQKVETTVAPIEPANPLQTNQDYVLANLMKDKGLLGNFSNEKPAVKKHFDINSASKGYAQRNLFANTSRRAYQAKSSRMHQEMSVRTGIKCA